LDEGSELGVVQAAAHVDQAGFEVAFVAGVCLPTPNVLASRSGTS
jgi:hypothetical protein